MNISGEDANDQLQQKTLAHQGAGAPPESKLLGVTPRWKGQSRGREQEPRQPEGSHCSLGPGLWRGSQRIPVKAEASGSQSRDRLTQIQGCRLAGMVVADSTYPLWGGLFGIKSR